MERVGGGGSRMNDSGWTGNTERSERSMKIRDWPRKVLEQASQGMGESESTVWVESEEYWRESGEKGNTPSSAEECLEVQGR